MATSNVKIALADNSLDKVVFHDLQYVFVEPRSYFGAAFGLIVPAGTRIILGSACAYPKTLKVNDFFYSVFFFVCLVEDSIYPLGVWFGVIHSRYPTVLYFTTGSLAIF